MAVLEKIRVKFGILITILIAVALLSFIVDPDTLRSTFQMFSSENKVGEMNGKAISYKDFYEELNYYTKLSELTGQGSTDEEGQAALRDAAWQSIFDKEVFIPAATKAGVAVCDDEIVDLSQGNQVSPVLAQQPMFIGQDGVFSRELLAQFIQSAGSDASGNADFYWNYLENAVYKQQLYTKYASLIEKSNIQSAVELRRTILENNVISDVDFVMIPAGFEQDSTITVSAQEIKDFYNARKSNMKQPANRDIEYVLFEVVPSQEDIDNTKQNFDSLYEDFKTADNLKNFVALNSDGKWDTYYYKKSQLESVPEYAEYAFGKDRSGVSAIHTTDESFSAARVVSAKSLADSAKIHYATFPLQNESSADSLVAAAKKAGKVTPDFTEMGWINQEGLLANGLDAFNVVFDPQEGKVIKVKLTNSQAWFVLYVEERTKPVDKVQLATFVKNILPSEETYRDYLMKATELADKCAGKFEKFAEAVKADNLPVIPMNNMVESTKRVGVCENARELVRWVFDKGTKKGDVSEVIIVDNKYYYVAAVTETRKAGITPLKDVQEEIRMNLASEKKIEKNRAEIAEKIKDCTTIEQIAEVLGTTVSHQNGVSFGSLQNQSLDPKFIGAVAGAEQGVICGPIAGDIGVYVFQVSDKETGTFFTENDAKTGNAQISSYRMNIMQTVLADAADITDNRVRFF